MANEKKLSSTFNLKISDDGKSIINEEGEVIANFTDDMIIKSVNDKSKLPGHMKCDWECLAYDSNGNCVRWHKTCTWVFD